MAMFSSRYFGTKKGSQVVVVSTPTWNNIVTLLNGNGASGKSNNTFLDSSANNFALTATGTTTQGAVSPFNPNWSNYFDGSSAIYIPSQGALVPNLGTYTFECWLNYNSLAANSGLISNSHNTGNDAGIGISSSTQIQIGNHADTSNITINLSTPMLPKTWYHLAITSDGTNIKVYINGKLSGTATDAGTGSLHTGGLYIGCCTSSLSTLYTWNGYISNLRVNTNLLYAADFTPPTSPLTAISGTTILACNSNSFKDMSSNNFTFLVAGGNPIVSAVSPFKNTIEPSYNNSVYLNGSSTISYPSSANYNMGSGNFTVECWIYKTAFMSNGSSENIFQIGPTLFANNTANSILVSANPSGVSAGSAMSIWCNNTAFTTTYTLTLNTWTHIALVKNSNVTTLYINGVSVYSTADTFTYSSTYLGIGNGWAAGGNFFLGTISNFRVTKGTAIYTSNFTVPTIALTAISNTQLLTCTKYGTADMSVNGAVATTGGTPTQSTLTPFFACTPITGSVSFNGSTDLLTAPASCGVLGSGDFTIEFWINPSSIPATGPGIVGNVQGSSTSMRATTWGLWMTNTGCISFISWYDVFLRPTTVLAVGQWTHVAVVKSSGTVSAYFNGVKDPVTAANANNYSYNGWNVGVGKIATDPNFGGNLSNLRIVIGTAVYTSNFVPPRGDITAVSGTSLLTCQGDMTDKSTNAYTITTTGTPKASTMVPAIGTSGSMYFSGSTTYLSVPSNANLAMGAGDFTIEGWINVSKYDGSNHEGLFNLDTSYAAPSFSSSGLIAYCHYTSRLVRFVIGGTDYATTITSTENTWTHIAISRTASSTKCFVNGTLALTIADATNYTSTYLVVGRNGSNYLNGYVSNFRIVKGTGLYTAAFVPPTLPLTAVTNTQLLLSGTNGGVTDSTGVNDVITFGTAGISTAQSKFGGSSLYFDGNSSNYLQMPMKPEIMIWGNDFTIEGHVYLLSYGSTRNLLTNSVSNSDGMTGIYVYTTGQIAIGKIGTNEIVSSSGVIQLNTWYHVAIVRSSNVVTIYVNGVSVATGDTTRIGSSTTNPITIGRNFQTTGNAAWYGYIDDLRITNGQALYTSNFTVPTSQLT